MNQRQSRVAEEVRHAAANALLRGDLPTMNWQGLTGLPLHRLNITAAWVSPDLRQARLYIALPQEADEAAVLAEANRQLAAPLRKVLSQTLAGKVAPSLSFHPTEDVL